MCLFLFAFAIPVGTLKWCKPHQILILFPPLHIGFIQSLQLSAYFKTYSSCSQHVTGKLDQYEATDKDFQIDYLDVFFTDDLSDDFDQHIPFPPSHSSSLHFVCLCSTVWIRSNNNTHVFCLNQALYGLFFSSLYFSFCHLF